MMVYEQKRPARFAEPAAEADAKQAAGARISPVQYQKRAPERLFPSSFHYDPDFYFPSVKMKPRPERGVVQRLPNPNYRGSEGDIFKDLKGYQVGAGMMDGEIIRADRLLSREDDPRRKAVQLGWNAGVSFTSEGTALTVQHPIGFSSSCEKETGISAVTPEERLPEGPVPAEAVLTRGVDTCTVVTIFYGNWTYMMHLDEPDLKIETIDIAFKAYKEQKAQTPDQPLRIFCSLTDDRAREGTRVRFVRMLISSLMGNQPGVLDETPLKGSLADCVQNGLKLQDDYVPPIVSIFDRGANPDYYLGHAEIGVGFDQDRLSLMGDIIKSEYLKGEQPIGDRKSQFSIPIEELDQRRLNQTIMPPSSTCLLV